MDAAKMGAWRHALTRVITGSLMLYAVLGTCAALNVSVASGGLSAPPEETFQRHTNRQETSHVCRACQPDEKSFIAHALADIKIALRAATIAKSDAGMRAMPSFVKRHQVAMSVWNNMTYSASGKQLALKLEMSRAQFGNLLFPQVAPN